MSFQARKALGESQKWFKKYRVKKVVNFGLPDFLGWQQLTPRIEPLQVYRYKSMGYGCPNFETKGFRTGFVKRLQIKKKTLWPFSRWDFMVSMHPPLFFSAGEGGVEGKLPTKFSKKGGRGLARSQFLEGVTFFERGLELLH